MHGNGYVWDATSTLTQLLQNFTVSEKLRISLPHPQNPTAGPHTGAHLSLELRNSLLTISILSSHLRLRLSSSLISWGIPTKTSYQFIKSPIRATCSSRHRILDLTNPTVWGEEMKLWTLTNVVVSSLVLHFLLIQTFF